MIQRGPSEEFGKAVTSVVLLLRVFRRGFLHQRDPLAHGKAERCDELLLLREGRLLARGTPAEILTRTGAHGLDDAFLRLVDEASA